MIDVKKLITGFLILAVAGGATALIVSNISSTIATNNTAIVATVTPATQAPVTGNAFLPVPTTDNSDGSGDVTLPAANDPTLSSSTDPNNLTNTLADAYLTDLMSANPDGPAVDASGNETLTPPDNTMVLAQLESNPTSTVVAIPDWDAEAAEIPITIGSSSPDAIANYSSAIESIFNQDLVEPNVSSMLANNSDPSAATYIEPKLQSALQDIAGLQTPASLVTFQKSLITYLVYGKNTLALTQGISSSSDPLKDALILQAETQKYGTVAQNLTSQLQQAAAVNGFAPFAMNTTGSATQNPAGTTAMVDKLLGIHTANAIFGLGDIVFDPSNFEQLLVNYAENIALQIAKNLIMFIMQKTVLAWIQGSGMPRFIQNWGTTLVSAFTQSAINALNSQMQCIGNSPFQAQVKLTLGATYSTSNNVCAVQFQNALNSNNSLTKFYNNFASGGWLTFGSTLKPDNDYYGSVLFSAQAVAYTAQNSQNAVQAKSVANQGWNGTEICVNSGTDPNTGCKPGDLLNGSGLCQKTGSTATYQPQGGGGVCSNGSAPQVLQPGQVTGQVFNSAVDSGGKLTAAANSIAGLLDAFTTSLLNSIASSLITATTGALENIGSTGTGAPGSGQSGQVPISCTPTYQNPNNPYEVTFIGAGGQTTSVSNGQVTTSIPSYTWSVTGSGGANPATGTGGQFDTVLNASGTYLATITDTTPGDGNAQAQCNVQAPAPQ